MSRVSTRDIVIALRQASIADTAGHIPASSGASVGPKVSDDIQLVYVVDYLNAGLFNAGGVGLNIAAGGQFGVIEIQCRNRAGLIIDYAGGTHRSQTDNQESFQIWTDDMPTIWGATGPNIFTPSPATGPGTLRAIATTGSIVAGQLNGEAQRIPPSFWNPVNYWVAPGQFFKVTDLDGGTTNIGIQWHELDNEVPAGL